MADAHQSSATHSTTEESKPQKNYKQFRDLEIWQTYMSVWGKVWRQLAATQDEPRELISQTRVTLLELVQALARAHQVKYWDDALRLKNLFQAVHCVAELDALLGIWIELEYFHEDDELFTELQSIVKMTIGMIKTAKK